MKCRIVVSLLALVTVFGLSANAQELPKIDVSASYSYMRSIPATSGFNSFSSNGGSASVAYNFRDWLSGVADFGGYHVGNNNNGVNVDNHLITYLFGPRLTYRGYRRFSPFAQFLVGGARAGSGVFAANSNTAFASDVGVGVDWNVKDRFSIRPLQFDYILTHLPEGANTTTQNNLRVSTGIVFHFK